MIKYDIYAPNASTGVWLEDLSKQVSSTVKLYGCDVSPNNFSKHHAENISFCLASVTSLPPDWSDKFDLIHQRLLFGGIHSSEWPIALSEIHRVLKPGGGVQLLELDFSHIVSAGPATRRLQSLFIDVFNKRGLLYDCSSRLPELLDQAKFVDVRSEKRYLMAGKAWGKIGELTTANFIGVFTGLIPALLASNIISSGHEMEEILKEGVEEWDRSEEGVRFVGHIVCARKAFKSK